MDDNLIQEVIEIEKRSDNMNTRDGARRLPTTRKPVLRRSKNMILKSGATSISEPIDKCEIDPVKPM